MVSKNHPAKTISTWLKDFVVYFFELANTILAMPAESRIQALQQQKERATQALKAERARQKMAKAQKSLQQAQKIN